MIVKRTLSVRGIASTYAAKKTTSLEKEHKAGEEEKTRFIVQGFKSQFGFVIEKTDNLSLWEKFTRLFTHKRLSITDQMGTREVDVNIRSLARLHLTLGEIRGAHSASDLALLINRHVTDKGALVRVLHTALSDAPKGLGASRFVRRGHQFFDQGGIVIKPTTPGTARILLNPGREAFGEGGTTRVFAATDLHTADEWVVRRAKTQDPQAKARFEAGALRSRRIHKRLSLDGKKKVPGVHLSSHEVYSLTSSEKVYLDTRAAGDLLVGLGKPDEKNVVVPGPLRKLTGKQILRGFIEPLRGLAYMHNLSVVHGDPKLENMVFIDGQFFITDFGESSIYDPETKKITCEEGEQIDNTTSHLYTSVTPTMINRDEVVQLQNLDADNNAEEIFERNKARDVAGYALTMIDFLLFQDNYSRNPFEFMIDGQPCAVWDNEPRNHIVNYFNRGGVRKKLGLNQEEYNEFIDILSDMMKYNSDDYTTRLTAQQALDRYEAFVNRVYPE